MTSGKSERERKRVNELNEAPAAAVVSACELHTVSVVEGTSVWPHEAETEQMSRIRM